MNTETQAQAQTATTAGPEMVNAYHNQIQQAQLKALCPLHDTFRTGRYYKKNWTSK
jgi:hypothetical protein